MSNQDLTRLFTPGTGVVPPYLAGRKREQEYFRDCVEALKNRKPISQDMIIYGPRGNGKTALLGYLQQETLRKEGAKLDVQWATPREMEHPGKFIDLVIGDHSGLRDKLTSGGFSIDFGIAKANVEIDLTKRPLTIQDLLQERCQSKPLILIIDEAHRMSPQMGEELLNASQQVRRNSHPFLLVLAGTPNLMAALGKANASFWGRSKILPLGRLSPDEAGQAVTVPLEQAGISFAPGVVDEIVGRTHCYPFFLQIWGDCLARNLAQIGQTEITLDMLREVEAEAHRDRDAMYQTRFNEIREMRLLSVAGSVANAFLQSGQPVLHTGVLEDAIAKGMAADDEPVTDRHILDKFEQLSHIGYVWQVEGANYEPGIPSLMTYVHRNSVGQQPKA